MEADVAGIKSQVTASEASSVSREEYSSLSNALSETKGGLSEAVRSIDSVCDTLAASQDALKKQHSEALEQQQLTQRKQAEQLDELVSGGQRACCLSSSSRRAGQPNRRSSSWPSHTAFTASVSAPTKK